MTRGRDIANFGGGDVSLDVTSVSTTVPQPVTSSCTWTLGRAWTLPQDQHQRPRGAMESTLEPAGPATGPVTFSHVFGQQCQLMEAGRSVLCSGESLLCNLECEGRQCHDWLAYLL